MPCKYQSHTPHPTNRAAHSQVSTHAQPRASPLGAWGTQPGDQEQDMKVTIGPDLGEAVDSAAFPEVQDERAPLAQV